MDASTTHDQELSSAANPTISWTERYEGSMVVASIGSKAVAGISGPWGNQYALTWWDRPGSSRRLEFYDSIEAARAEVENWANFVISALSSMNAEGTEAQAEEQQPSLLRRLIGLLCMEIWPASRQDEALDRVWRTLNIELWPRQSRDSGQLCLEGSRSRPTIN